MRSFDLENFDTFPQLGNNAGLCVWFVLTMFSIAFFNFSGMYVTQKVGATARTVLDSVRFVSMLFRIQFDSTKYNNYPFPSQVYQSISYFQ